MYENRKRYSQNFLRSSFIVRKLLIDSGLNFHEKEMILEIGPGNGIITRQLTSLIDVNSQIIGVEIDPLLTDNLKRKFANDKNVKIVNSDFLEFELPRNSFTLVSNIPFYCTSYIMRRLLDPKNTMDSALLIMQKEAAEMYIGDRGSTMKSLLAYPFWDFKIVRRLNKSDFLPKSGVDSLAIRVDRRDTTLIPLEEINDYEKFIKIISRDRAGEGIWRQVFTKKQLYRLENSYGLIRNRGISSQNPEVIMRGFKYLSYRML